MTEDQVATVLALLVSAIAVHLSLGAVRLRRGVRVRGKIVGWKKVGGEDPGYVREVAYHAGHLGERRCQPLDLVRDTPGETDVDVDLIYLEADPTKVAFVDFPYWKPAIFAWLAVAFILWTIWRK